MDAGTTISVIGLPGSGKSTLSRTLAVRLSAPRLSTGEAVRELATHDDALRARLAAGELAPESIIAEVVERFLSTTATAATRLLDGYPRHRAQAQHLLERSWRLVVVRLDVDAGVARTRITSRGDSRVDDSPTALEQRFRHESASLADVSQIVAKDLLAIDGRLAPDQIADLVVERL
jgi:adenylate kinase